MRGRVAIGPADAVGTHLLPLASVMPDGHRLRGDESFLTPSTTDSEAVALFAQGKVDAMFGWVPDGAADAVGGTLARPELAGLGMRVIWTSPPLRRGIHAIRSGLPDDAKAELRAALTSAPPEVVEQIGGMPGALVSVGHDDFATAVDLVRVMAGREAR